MAKNKTRIADATRCLMCYQPICDIACQKKVFPAGIIHAFTFEEMRLEHTCGQQKMFPAFIVMMQSVKSLRTRTGDSPIRIQEICRYVSQNEKHITREHTSRVVGQLLWHQM